MSYLLYSYTMYMRFHTVGKISNRIVYILPLSYNYDNKVLMVLFDKLHMTSRIFSAIFQYVATVTNL